MNKASQKGIKILKDLKKNEYIINDGKFIIKYESHNRYELLLGNYNLDIEKLEPEILFKYKSNESIKNHFENFEKYSYKIFKVEHSSQDGLKLTLYYNDESKNEFVGRIFNLNNKNSNHKDIKEQNMNVNANVNDINLNKNKIVEEPKIVLVQTNKNHIEFLYRLHL